MDASKTIVPGQMERRAFPLEIRASSEAGRSIVGHAAVFNITADIGGWFKERINPGAFTESIAQDDVRALFNHDPNIVLGRNKANTLRLSEDETGLAIDIDLPDTQAARDLTVSMERGDISQMSISFEVLDASWDTIDGEEVRVLKRVKLWDVSPVTFPAYVETDAQVRGIFTNAGMDLTHLAQAVIRSQHGSLTHEDRDVIQASINQLEQLTEDRQGPERAQGRSDILRKRLDLADRE